MIKLAYIGSVTAFNLICVALMVGIVWCALIDTRPPIAHVSGKLVSYNPVTTTALIEWTAIKNRRCDGWRAGWMRENHPEPPPRLVEYLEPKRIPPDGFKSIPAPSGSEITWRSAAIVPPSLIGQDVIYVAQWEFSCNLWQRLIPLQVDSALIDIPAQ